MKTYIIYSGNKETDNYKPLMYVSASSYYQALKLAGGKYPKGKGSDLTCTYGESETIFAVKQDNQFTGVLPTIIKKY